MKKGEKKIMKKEKKRKIVHKNTFKFNLLAFWFIFVNLFFKKWKMMKNGKMKEKVENGNFVIFSLFILIKIVVLLLFSFI